MMEITLLAEVTFRSDGPSQLRFPLTQPIRLSLWPVINPLSAPAIFQIQEPMHADTAYILRIDTLLVAGLEAVMQPGALIRFGVPPTRFVGEGRIISIETVERGPAVWVTPKTLNGPI